MPSTVLGLLLFVVLLAPGAAYRAVRERFEQQRKPSVFRETARIALVSVVANLTVLVVFSLIRAVIPAHTPNAGDLISTPARYFAARPGYVGLWALGAFALAVVLAAAVATPKAHAWGVGLIPKAVSEAQPFKSSWTELFQIDPEARMYVGCVLDDGSYVAGPLYGWSTDADDGPDREITLTGDIYYRASGRDQGGVLPNVGAMAISARHIVTLSVTYLDPNQPPAPPAPVPPSP